MVRSRRSVIGRLVERYAVRSGEGIGRIAGEINNAQMSEARFALKEQEVPGKRVRSGEHGLGAMRNDLAPVFAARIGGGRRDQAKVSPAEIRSNIEEISTVIGVVLVLFLARSDQPKSSADLVRRQKAYFTGGVARAGEQKKCIASRAFNGD